MSSASSITITNSNKFYRTSSSNYAPGTAYSSGNSYVEQSWIHENYGTEEYPSADFTIYVQLYACVDIQSLAFRIRVVANNPSWYSWRFGVTAGDANSSIVLAFTGLSGTPTCYGSSLSFGTWSSWYRWPEGQENNMYFKGWCGDTRSPCNNGGTEASNSALGTSGTYNGNYMTYNIFNINTSSLTWYTAPTCSGNASVTAISGTTVTVRVPSWTNGTDSATATIVCSNYSSGATIDTKTITSSSGGTVTFTGLENGVRYRFKKPRLAYYG